MSGSLHRSSEHLGTTPRPYFGDDHRGRLANLECSPVGVRMAWEWRVGLRA